MNGEKEAYFYQYCPSCTYYSKPEAEDPCDECLAMPVNEDSHKPVYYKKARGKKTATEKCRRARTTGS